MTADAELLRKYVSEGSEQAFTELVQRHINLVYGAAIREVGGDAGFAEEVCQEVFLHLARKSSGLVRHPALAGWIYTSVRYIAANLRRSEARRKYWEMQSHILSEPLVQGDQKTADWQEIKPLLDDALHNLTESDRAVVVLRFFEKRTIEQVGEALGLTKGAAHMRIDRALERLRCVLLKRGISSTASSLTAVLAVGAALSAPAGLAANITTKVITLASTTGSAAITTKLVTMTKIKLGLAGAVLVASIATPVVIQHQTQAKLLKENNDLRTQLQDQDLRMTAEKQQLSNEIVRLSSRLQTRLPGDSSDLLRLRGEVTRLRKEAQQSKGVQVARASLPKKTPQENANEGRSVRVREQADLAAKQADLAVKAATSTNGTLPEGAITLTTDDSGNQHIMKLSNGTWQEVQPEEGYSVTPDGVVFRGITPANSSTSVATRYETVAAPAKNP